MEMPLNSFYFHLYFRWFQAGSWWISAWCWCTSLFVKAASTNLESSRILLLITGPSLKEDVSNSYMDLTASIKKWVIKTKYYFSRFKYAQKEEGTKTLAVDIGRSWVTVHQIKHTPVLWQTHARPRVECVKVCFAD